MPPTLRRSCAACAKSKHSCDLRTPRCSRCVKRNVECTYANEPLTAPSAPSLSPGRPRLDSESHLLTTYDIASRVDPFDSYPQTRLRRDHVQRLIHGFLHKIAFTYYPLDLNAASNPFLISWWPLALGDPALFHVTLQTACLDEELRAQRGFQTSDLLMADSVALLRRKVDDDSLALQDGTMNSVITLAAIEFGKGNVKLGEMHVEGVKKLVDLRGGISSVRETSPLTARMVSWVSMLIMGHPQFETQSDAGVGRGIRPIPEWQLEPIISDDDMSELDIDPDICNVLVRLRNVFHRWQKLTLSPTDLHDLTCFVVHRLLFPSCNPSSTQSPLTECLRCAIVLYMLTVQGPTYFPHEIILHKIVVQLMNHLLEFESMPHLSNSMDVWLMAVGMVASTGTPHYQWFAKNSQGLVASMRLHSWKEVLVYVKRVLWLATIPAEQIFRVHWEALPDIAGHPEPPDAADCNFSGNGGVEIL